MSYIFPPAPQQIVSIKGVTASYPIRRIFCVGRNYVAHAAEMGGKVDREAPWYFTKSPFSAALSGLAIPYALGTKNLHHEVELVVALGGDVFQGNTAQAAEAVYGYGCGLDMTRRDLQQQGKDQRRPWDFGKDFENGAILGALTPVADFGLITDQLIKLAVNGDVRQSATLADMVWSVPELISHLSYYYLLGAGDLIMTGTPAGVGPVVPGDVLEGTIAGLSPVTVSILEPECDGVS